MSCYIHTFKMSVKLRVVYVQRKQVHLMPSNKILLFIRKILYLDFTIFSYIFIVLYTWLECSENNINNLVIFPFASKLSFHRHAQCSLFAHIQVCECAYVVCARACEHREPRRMVGVLPYHLLPHFLERDSIFH